MYQGFYNLASGMLTQSRNLNVISNNMINIQTAGYKSDKMVSSTFQEEIQTEAGERYTRNGSFSVDQEGFLVLDHFGRVLSTDNQPIQIDNENFTVDGRGHITATITTGGGDEDSEMETEIRDYGTLKVVDFADYDQLHKEDNGLISTDQAQIVPGEGQAAAPIVWKAIEKSNVDMVEEMTSMMSSQRALQSAAQVLKMYDQIMSRYRQDKLGLRRKPRWICHFT